MLKPLTFSLSLAVALGFCSVSKAGGLMTNCTTCGLASPQGGPYASGQGGRLAASRPVPPRSTASVSTCRRFTATFRSCSHTVQLRVGLEEEAQLLASFMAPR